MSGGSFEIELERIPGAAEDAGHRYVGERKQRIFAEGFAIHQQAQGGDGVALAHRGDQRLAAADLGLEPLGVAGHALGQRDHEVGGEARAHGTLGALVDARFMLALLLQDLEDAGRRAVAGLAGRAGRGADLDAPSVDVDALLGDRDDDDDGARRCAVGLPFEVCEKAFRSLFPSPVFLPFVVVNDEI